MSAYSLYHPQLCNSQIHSYIPSFLPSSESQQTLEALSAEEFEKHKQALTVRRSEKPKKLKDEFYKHLAEILCQEYHFNRGIIPIS